MRKNKLKKLFKEGKAAINGWLEIPSSFSAEAMSNQGWDSLTIDMQHGAIDNSKVLEIFSIISKSKAGFFFKRLIPDGCIYSRIATLGIN